MDHTPNASFFSFRTNGGEPVRGIKTPLMHIGGNQVYRGIVLGRRRQVGMHHGKKVFEPINGTRMLLESLASPPAHTPDGNKLLACSIQKDAGGKRVIAAPTGDGKYLLLVQSGLSTNAHHALEEYATMLQGGKQLRLHGCLFNDGAHLVESAEDAGASGEPQREGANAQLVKRIQWAVARDRVPGLDVPLWREDVFLVSPGADMYVFGVNDTDAIRLIVTNAGELQTEHNVDVHVRERFEEMDIARMQRRAAERAARAAKKA